MKAASVVGIFLVIVGVISLLAGRITYTRKETVLDLGPIEAQTETRETIPLPPLVGGVALAGGVLLLVIGARKQ
jgi:uncharacterized membrane protein YidH (DUF202 family)